jgi:hypothetical protein
MNVAQNISVFSDFQMLVQKNVRQLEDFQNCIDFF